jgi:protein-S-isoprenylcysteine O-methyltransferase
MEEKFKSFGIYFAFLSMFHFSEYFFIALSHPQSLTTDSFMLNHSLQYEIAAIASWAEFFTEVYFFPEMKKVKTIWLIGSLVCVAGELLRKVAILTARKSFHHLVQFQQADDHKLITNGVYSWFRHPAYVGWFYFSIGTQVILANPICLILYPIASWLFFYNRINTEEIALLNFFGDDYVKYQKTTKTGLPFIKGYQLP